MTRNKRKRPEFEAMLSALEKHRPGYSVKLASEATDWPSKGFATRTLIRRRVGIDWDHLPARQRAAAAIKAATPAEEDGDDE